VKIARQEIVPLLARVLLAIVFASAAVPKLIDPGAFAADVQNYRVLPQDWAGHAALFVPAFELVIAIGLLIPAYARGAALIAACMLFLFSGAMAQARMRGIDLSCGCFGAAFEAKVSWLTVARSAALGLLACVPLLLPRRPHGAGSAKLSVDA
jgi:uncharacterized membrane protein YphA (DoxX/SURF4 family)